MEARRKSPQGRQEGEKKSINYIEKVYKSNSAMKCVDERGTMKVRVNLSHKESQVPWMSSKKKNKFAKALGLSFHKSTFGKKNKVPLELLNFLCSRVG